MEQAIAGGAGIRAASWLDGAHRAIVAGIHRLQQFDRLHTAHLAQMMRSGRMRKAFRVRSRAVTAVWFSRPVVFPGGSRVRGASAAGGILDGHHAFVSPMNWAMMLSKVVLPAPVPPLMTMLQRAATRGLEEFQHVLGQCAVGQHGPRLSGSRRNCVSTPPGRRWLAAG